MIFSSKGNIKFGGEYVEIGKFDEDAYNDAILNSNKYCENKSG